MASGVLDRGGARSHGWTASGMISRPSGTFMLTARFSPPLRGARPRAVYYSTPRPIRATQGHAHHAHVVLEQQGEGLDVRGPLLDVLAFADRTRCCRRS